MSKIKLLSPRSDAHLAPHLAAIHAACIYHDGIVAAFVQPLDTDKLLAYWQEMIREAGAGKRLIAIQLDDPDPRSGAEGPKLNGVATLSLAQDETSTHRAHLGKLMVRPSAQQRSIAKELVRFLEAMAMTRTEAGSLAERTYSQLGYVKYGTVPGCSIDPSETARVVDGVFCYKKLS
ncbi:acyl-CoA N-acyltransferase [Xylaria cf. heliscus]|nr:acyl-CoA N-acyltransferase [Xylaria cf. heliscus]